MHPLLIQNQSITIGSYPLCYGLGLVCGGIILGLLLNKRGFGFRDTIQLWWIICLLVYFGGILTYVIIYPPHRGHLTWAWLVSMTEGGQVLYGGLICGTVGGWYACRRLHLPLTEALDASGVAVPVGIAIGRVGCLLKGCCYGARSDSWSAIRYPKVVDIYGNLIGSGPYLDELKAYEIQATDTCSLPLHPVPIYESLVCLGMASVLFVLWRRRILSGRLIFVFGGSYAVWRFNVEFIRVHERLLGFVTLYQLISIGVLVASLAACILLNPARLAASAPPPTRVARQSRRRRRKKREKQLQNRLNN
jgi:phosphatidylglycerol:prolipoprotein diacylglycerol transferase